MKKLKEIWNVIRNMTYISPFELHFKGNKNGSSIYFSINILKIVSNGYEYSLFGISVHRFNISQVEPYILTIDFLFTFRSIIL